MRIIDLMGMGPGQDPMGVVEEMMAMVELVPVVSDLAAKDKYYMGVYEGVKAGPATDKQIVEAAVYILAGFVRSAAEHLKEEWSSEQIRHNLHTSSDLLRAIKELQLAAQCAEPDGTLLDKETAETVETVEGGN